MSARLHLLTVHLLLLLQLLLLLKLLLLLLLLHLLEEVLVDLVGLWHLLEEVLLLLVQLGLACGIRKAKYSLQVNQLLIALAWEWWLLRRENLRYRLRDLRLLRHLLLVALHHLLLLLLLL
jgi:hypothetical protein